MSNDNEGDALALIQAVHRRDLAGAVAIYEASPNPGYLTGQCVRTVLDIAQGIADQAGAADGGAALVAGILEQAASPAPQSAPEPPEPGPQPIIVDIGSAEAVAAAKAALLAAFDDDDAGMSAVLGTLTHVEAVSVAAVLARIFVTFVGEDDRAGAREQLARSMRPGPAQP
jgi:hypothetical protein